MPLYKLDEARTIKTIEGLVRKFKRITSGKTHHKPDMRKYQKTFLGDRFVAQPKKAGDWKNKQDTDGNPNTYK